MIRLRLRQARWALLPLLVALVAAGSVATPAAARDATSADTTQPRALHVMTFNLRYASDSSPNSWGARRPVMKELLLAASPDIIGTQEGLHQQLLDIQSDLPDHYDSIGEGREGGTQGEAMQIFYNTQRLEPLEFGHYWLSDTPDVVGSQTWPGCCPRMVTWIRFKDTASGDQFYSINTHLEAFDGTARSLGADLILERMKRLDPTLPVVLTADFNEAGVKGGTVYDKLVTNGPFEDTWEQAEERSPYVGTFHDYRPLNPNGAKIDWILTSPGVRTRSAAINTYSRGGQFPSDHLPVEAVIELPEVESVQPADVFTRPGNEPAMPTTVVPVYWDGPRGTLPVTWDTPADEAWSEPGTVTVSGVAKDSLGREYPVKAVVVVDDLTTTEPTRAKTFAGGQPDLPAQVTAVGGLGKPVVRPVTWDAPTPGAFDHAGVVTVSGRADAGGGETLPATVRVQVTEPVEENAARAAGTSVAATFTEPGYSTTGLVNGTLTDKAWSNWKSGAKNPGDTITVTLPKPRAITHVATAFYRDGRDSYAQSLRIQARDAQGAWVDVSGDVTVRSGAPAPVVDVPVAATTTDAVRVVLTARPETYMTVSEIQVFANTPGRSSDATAATIAVDGAEVPAFDPETLGYRVPVARLPRVTAVAADPYATVVVTQAADAEGTATVAVTSEDGAQSRTYRVVLLPPAWSATTAYATGDRVSYQDKVYQASWYAKNQKPGVDPNGAWQELATAEDGTAIWTASRIFNAGDVVTHDGKTYRARWYTRNQKPGDPNGPWAEIAPTPDDGPAAWTPTTVYEGGDRVTHDGHVYEARWWTRNQVPGDPNGPWKAIG